MCTWFVGISRIRSLKDPVPNWGISDLCGHFDIADDLIVKGIMNEMKIHPIYFLNASYRS